MTSQLNVDTIVDKAGSGGTNVKVGNTSTYVADGGSATQNLVQGLLKCWHYGSAAGDDAYDSFNLSSLGDTGAGHQTVNFANSFNNNAYVVTASQGTGNQHHVKIDSRATSSQQIKVYDPDVGAFQDSTQFSQFSGDLA